MFQPSAVPDGQRASVPLTVTASVTNPRRASSRLQPSTGSSGSPGRLNSARVMLSAEPPVPGTHTTPGSGPSASTGAHSTAGAVSPIEFEKRSLRRRTPSSISDGSAVKSVSVGTDSSPRSSISFGRTPAPDTGEANAGVTSLGMVVIFSVG